MSPSGNSSWLADIHSPPLGSVLNPDQSRNKEFSPDTIVMQFHSAIRKHKKKTRQFSCPVDSCTRNLRFGIGPFFYISELIPDMKKADKEADDSRGGGGSRMIYCRNSQTVSQHQGFPRFERFPFPCRMTRTSFLLFPAAQ